MMAFGVEPTGYLGAMFYDSIATKLVTIEAPGIVTEPWGDVSSKFMARNFIEFGFCQGYFFGVSATTDSVEYNIVASGSSDLLPESVADVQLQIPFSSLHLGTRI
jgi:K+-transporting ATPase c subunit